MKKITLENLLMVCAAAALLAIPFSYLIRPHEAQAQNFQYTADRLPAEVNQQVTRAGAPQTGAWTAIACTNSSAASAGPFASGVRVMIQCNDTTYVRWASATAPTAVNTDGYLSSGAIFEWTVTDTHAKYVSCLNKTNALGCQYLLLY